MKPLNEHVIVERIARRKSEGGVLLPEQERHEVRLARVVEVGPGYPTAAGFMTITLGRGDLVLTRPNRGLEFQFEGRKLEVISVADILVSFGEGSPTMLVTYSGSRESAVKDE